MDIRVSGHQVDTGDALREHVDERLQAVAEKYFARSISAHVTFGKGPHDVGFTCSCKSLIPSLSRPQLFRDIVRTTLTI